MENGEWNGEKRARFLLFCQQIETVIVWVTLEDCLSGSVNAKASRLDREEVCT